MRKSLAMLAWCVVTQLSLVAQGYAQNYYFDVDPNNSNEIQAYTKWSQTSPPPNPTIINGSADSGVLTLTASATGGLDNVWGTINNTVQCTIGPSGGPRMSLTGLNKLIINVKGQNIPESSAGGIIGKYNQGTASWDFGNYNSIIKSGSAANGTPCTVSGSLALTFTHTGPGTSTGRIAKLYAYAGGQTLAYMVLQSGQVMKWKRGMMYPTMTTHGPLQYTDRIDFSGTAKVGDQVQIRFRQENPYTGVTTALSASKDEQQIDAILDVAP